MFYLGHRRQRFIIITSNDVELDACDGGFTKRTTINVDDASLAEIYPAYAYVVGDTPADPESLDHYRAAMYAKRVAMNRGDGMQPHF